MATTSTASDGRTHLAIVRQRPLHEHRAPPLRPSRHRILIGLGALAVVGVGVLVAELARPPGILAARFEVVPATLGDLQPAVGGPVRLQPWSVATVVAPGNGQMEKLLVRAGDRVTAGAALAVLEREPLRLGVRRADAWLAESEAVAAEMQLRLNQTMAMSESDGTYSPEEERPPTDEEVTIAIAHAKAAAADAEVAARQAGLRLAQVQLRAATVRAPIGGVVSAIDVTVGHPVSTGQRLLTIADDRGGLKAVLRVGDADIARVRVGQPAAFTAEVSRGKIGGQVAQMPLLSAIDDSVAGFPVTVVFPANAGALVAGMTGMVSIRVPSVSHVLRVPAQALSFSPAALRAPVASEPAVWTVRAGEPVRVPVLVGAREGDLVEVRSDQLHEGAPVIVSATAR